MVDDSGIRRGQLDYYFIGDSTNLELRRPFFDERELLTFWHEKKSVICIPYHLNICKRHIRVSKSTFQCLCN